MINAEKIVLSRAEGPVDKCITVEAKTFQEAESILRQWRQTAPGPNQSYHKTDFFIYYTDGEVYEGRIDLKRDDPETSDLAGHIRRCFDFHSGEDCPVHLSSAEYAAFIREFTRPGITEMNKAWLSKYQIGDGEVTPEKLSEVCVNVWQEPYDVENPDDPLREDAHITVTTDEKGGFFMVDRPEGQICAEFLGGATSVYFYRSEDAYRVAAKIKEMADWLKEKGV